MADTDRVGQVEKAVQVYPEDSLMVRREVLDLEAIDGGTRCDPIQEELFGRDILIPDRGPDLRLEHLPVPGDRRVPAEHLGHHGAATTADVEHGHNHLRGWHGETVSELAFLGTNAEATRYIRQRYGVGNAD
jgi:hypothetical protein